jgi:phosphatidylinositol alpha-1,6-mannosyltransferase
MPLRVLLVTPDFPPAMGGIQRLLERLVSHAAGVSYEVLTLAADGSEAWDAAQPYPIHRARSLPSRQASIAALNAAALAHARRMRPDVVLAGHIVTAPGAIAIRKALGIPYVAYFYALELRERPKLAGIAGRGSQAVIAISRYTAGLALDAGVPDGLVTIVPPGVDANGALPPADRDAPPRILTVARLQDRYKGFDVMARALPLVRARVPEAEWVVVGDGRLRAEIARQAQGAGDAVRLCGSVSDAERDGWYDRSAVFAMPSRLPPGSAGEGFGIVYLEAGTRGVPSVAGAVGGALDAVVDGETGLLVDPTSHVEVGAALARLLEDPAAAREMGAEAARFAQRFAWPKVAAEVEAVLHGVAGRG